MLIPAGLPANMELIYSSSTEDYDPEELNITPHTRTGGRVNSGEMGENIVRVWQLILSIYQVTSCSWNTISFEIRRKHKREKVYHEARNPDGKFVSLEGELWLDCFF